MAIDSTSIIAQIDALLQRQRNLRAKSQYDDLSDLPHAETSELITLMAAAIDRLSLAGSCYRREANGLMEKYGTVNPFSIPPLSGVLRALRSDYETGNLASVQQLVQSDIFADFLEMAHYLLEQGYKDPAGVLVGGVLEEHLRKLCERNSIAVESKGRPRKADALNSDLAKAEAYGKLDQKGVTTWLDLRNKAAHGNYSAYSREQVSLMLQGVRDFVVRTLL